MKRGFSFLELVIVLAIAGIIAVIALPRIAGVGSMGVDMVRDKVLADLRYVREYAVNRNDRTRVTFLIGQDRYVAEVFDASVEGEWRILEDPTTREDFDIRIGQGQYKDTELVGVSFNGGNIIEFDSYGAPFAGGGPLTGTGVVTMRGSGSVKIVGVFVEPVSGRIYITDLPQPAPQG